MKFWLNSKNYLKSVLTSFFFPPWVFLWFWFDIWSVLIWLSRNINLDKVDNLAIRQLFTAKQSIFAIWQLIFIFILINYLTSVYLVKKYPRIEYLFVTFTTLVLLLITYTTFPLILERFKQF
jgi:hypothetical protein